MNGSANISVTKIARILGTKTRVCSWIWVSAWNSDTTTPTTRPATIKGDDTTTIVQIASRATSRVSAPVIYVTRYLPHLPSSFRDGPKDQTRHLEIPGSMLRIAPG